MSLLVRKRDRDFTSVVELPVKEIELRSLDDDEVISKFVEEMI